jgi:hypothetical protein
MRTRPEPGTRVRCENRFGTAVAPDDPRAAAYRKERGAELDDQHHTYVRWDDGPSGRGGRGLCLVLNPVLQSA